MGFRKRRIRFAFFVITVLFASSIGYVAYLKTTKGDEYEQKALRQYTNRYDVELYPMRGSIVDRNLKELATSVPVYNVIFDPVVLNENSRDKEIRQKNIDKTINELSRLLDIPLEELNEYMKADDTGELVNPSRYIKLKKGISVSEADALNKLELKGVWTEDDSKREYPFGELAANVIGFIRGDASWGIESYYNEELTGEAGRAFITYTDSTTPEINKVPATNGYQVITTLDVTLQQYAEEALKNAVDAYSPQNGAIIVLNPNTSEILAMAVYPTFNLNEPMVPIYLQDPEFSALWEEKTEEEKIEELNREWKNYCIVSAFEPGSIFKPLVVAAAIDEGLINLNTTFTCGGTKTIYDEDIPCHYLPGHGIQTVEEVLANSCNIAMMDIAAMMGPELFYKHFRNFGFGEVTDIDLPGELSVRRWVFTREQFNNPVHLATSSFGQGPMCTPIQALNAFSAIINGGNVMKPYVVSQVIDDKGNVIIDNKPTVVRKILSTDTSDKLRIMMQSVVDYGTGNKAQITGYSIGGKTGTAQQGVREKDEETLTFIGYLPVEDPQLVALALLDKPEGEGHQGSATAAPMLKEFLENAIKYMGIKPADEAAVSEDMFAAADSVTVPDFTEMSMAEATQLILASDLKYESSGAGNTIKNQWPKVGTKVSRGSTLTLYTEKTGDEVTTVAVPDVVGMTYDEALKTLIDSSFRAIVSTENTDNMKVSVQTPRGGQHVPPESDVALEFETADEAPPEN